MKFGYNYHCIIVRERITLFLTSTLAYQRPRIKQGIIRGDYSTKFCTGVSTPKSNSLLSSKTFKEKGNPFLYLPLNLIYLLIRGSGLVFNVICPQFSVFAVKLANFLMFTVSEENTVKCSEGSSDIFGNGRTSSLVFGNLRQSSGIVGSVWKSCEKIRNCCKMAENALIF